MKALRDIILTMEEMDYVIGRVCRAVEILEKSKEFGYIIPEVGTNIAFSISSPESIEDVVAIPGRIRRIKGYPRACEKPSPGASDHLARFILEIRKYDSSIRSAINFAYNPTIGNFLREYAEKRGWKIGFVDRTQEPMEVKEFDGMSMPWKVKRAIEDAGGVPRIKCEFGGTGKEDLSLILGTDPIEITKEAIKIAEELFSLLNVK